MIEILVTKIVLDNGAPISRTVTISISDGQNAFIWFKGGLPLIGDLQPILDSQESELWQAASAAGQLFDVYELTVQRVLKALALVITDELNILRALHGLPDRTADQIKGAIKNRLKDV